MAVGEGSLVIVTAGPNRKVRGKVRGEVHNVPAPSGDIVKVIQIERPRGGLIWEFLWNVTEDEK